MTRMFPQNVIELGSGVSSRAAYLTTDTDLSHIGHDVIRPY